MKREYNLLRKYTILVYLKRVRLVGVYKVFCAEKSLPTIPNAKECTKMLDFIFRIADWLVANGAWLIDFIEKLDKLF